MFELSAEPIHPEPWRERLHHEEAGAVVTFEGWVRATNLGRSVTRLAFEASAELARNEFAAIEGEVREALEVIEVICVHRTGDLAVGELAVFIGVSAPHRDAAFRGCRQVIEQLKSRMPIWKKETYTDGDSGWINHP